VPDQDAELLGKLSGTFLTNCPNDKAAVCILELGEDPQFRETGIQTGPVAEAATDVTSHLFAWATYDPESNLSRTHVVGVENAADTEFEHVGLVNGLWLSNGGRYLVVRLFDPATRSESCYHTETYDLSQGSPIDVLAGYCVWGFAWASTLPEFVASISKPGDAGSSLARGEVATNTLQELQPRVSGEVQIDLSWSPDDQMLAYRDASSASQTPEVLHVLWSDSGISVVEAHPVGYALYAWAPDSTRIAFVGWSPISTPGDRAAVDVHILDVETGDVGYLTNTRVYTRFNTYDSGGIDIERVAWLPQSDSVVFSWDIDNQSWIVATSTTGGGSTEIAGYEYHPQYFYPYDP